MISRSKDLFSNALYKSIFEGDARALQSKQHDVPEAILHVRTICSKLCKHHHLKILLCLQTDIPTRKISMQFVQSEHPAVNWLTFAAAILGIVGVNIGTLRGVSNLDTSLFTVAAQHGTTHKFFHIFSKHSHLLPQTPSAFLLSNALVSNKTPRIQIIY